MTTSTPTRVSCEDLGGEGGQAGAHWSGRPRRLVSGALQRAPPPRPPARPAPSPSVAPHPVAPHSVAPHPVAPHQLAPQALGGRHQHGAPVRQPADDQIDQLLDDGRRIERRVQQAGHLGEEGQAFGRPPRRRAGPSVRVRRGGPAPGTARTGPPWSRGSVARRAENLGRAEDQGQHADRTFVAVSGARPAPRRPPRRCGR